MIKFLVIIMTLACATAHADLTGSTDDLKTANYDFTKFKQTVADYQSGNMKIPLSQIKEQLANLREDGFKNLPDVASLTPAMIKSMQFKVADAGGSSIGVIRIIGPGGQIMSGFGPIYRSEAEKRALMSQHSPGIAGWSVIAIPSAGMR